MRCEDVEKMIINYLDNNLTGDERTEIEKHIEKCEKCFDDINETQKILNSIDSSEMEFPDESLKINFYHMLHGEIKRNESGTVTKKNSQPSFWLKSNILRVAAGFALLIAGSFLGAAVTSWIKNSDTGNELAQLKSEVELLKKTAMYAMLKEESSSYRIQAVNYADDMKNPDENVIAALLKTLNHDKNVNVRMAAAYALEKFTDQKPVSDSLVKSLSLQVDPILQVALINILVEKRDKGAIEPMQKIISNSNTLKEVRDVAEKGIKVLL
jgi:HEAT repeat protein